MKEEKIVVALAASIMAGDGIPNPNLHIKKNNKEYHSEFKIYK